MSDRLFKKLCDVNLLKKAWHLARADAKNSFMRDPYAYNDFAFDLDGQLKLICQSLQNGTYHPHPLLRIDVPKSTYSVRPGSLIDIGDATVLYAIVLLIAPRLDKHLPDNVFSYRYRPPSKKRDTIFKDNEIIQHPFLKKSTIKRIIDIFDSWYETWPQFIEDSRYAFEVDNFHFLSVSDISAYFENINLEILQELLLKYFSKDQKIVNLLINIFEHWTWPTKHLRSVKRGIPQGNSISSFLGNFYLLPLDQAFQKFSKSYKIQYFRYMDDVLIFSKNRQTAIKVIFKMNEVCRELQLNIQGAKTELKEKEEIKEELFDERLKRVNPLIQELQRKRTVSKDRLEEIRKVLSDEVIELETDKRLDGNNLRLFRRLITGFKLMNDNFLVDRVLEQNWINPDSRFTASAAGYLSLFPTESKITEAILRFLESQINLFDYQEALLLGVLRYSYKNLHKVLAYARTTARKKRKHWYVRCQAINILANSVIHPKLFESYINMYIDENDAEVKRALIKLLCQLDSEKQLETLNDAIYNPYSKISNLAKMLISLRINKKLAIDTIKYIFRDYSESKLADNFYKLGVIRYHQDRDVLRRLEDSLTKLKIPPDAKYLRIKRVSILKQLQSYKQLHLRIGKEN